MGPSITVSCLPLYIAVTVAVNGTPATTLDGTLISRIPSHDPHLTHPIPPTLHPTSPHHNAGGQRNYASPNPQAKPVPLGSPLYDAVGSHARRAVSLGDKK